MCDAAAILKLNLIMLSMGPTFRIRAPTVALDNSVSVFMDFKINKLIKKVINKKCSEQEKDSIIRVRVG